MGLMPQPSYEYVASLMDHALLTPTSTDAELRKGCQALREFPIATVCIKPHAVKLAVEELAGTSIDVCTVIGFPHGTPLPSVKAFEAELNVADGVAALVAEARDDVALGETEFESSPTNECAHANAQRIDHTPHHAG